MENKIYLDLLKISKSRRTTKIFNKNLKISDETINKILEVANTAPSSLGMQLWRGLVISNEDLKESLIECFKDSNKEKIIQQSHLIFLVTKKDSYFVKDNKDLIERAKFQVEFGSKHYGFEPTEQKINDFIDFVINEDHGNNNLNKTEWSARCAYIVLPYILLAAESLGVKQTTMEGFYRKLDSKLIEKNMINNDEQVTLVIGLGYDSELNLPTHIGEQQSRFQISKQFKFYK